MPETVTKNWVVLEAAPDRFLDLLPEHPLLLQVLYNRGMRSAAEMSAFLAKDDAVVENPFRLPRHDHGCGTGGARHRERRATLRLRRF